MSVSFERREGVDYVVFTHEHGTSADKVARIKKHQPERFALFKDEYEAWLASEGEVTEPAAKRGRPALFSKKK